jgi:hypothetical protein
MRARPYCTSSQCPDQVLNAALAIYALAKRSLLATLQYRPACLCCMLLILLLATAPACRCCAQRSPAQKLHCCNVGYCYCPSPRPRPRPADIIEQQQQQQQQYQQGCTQLMVHRPCATCSRHTIIEKATAQNNKCPVKHDPACYCHTTHDSCQNFTQQALKHLNH